jgi:hypothetical protein
MPSVLPIKTLAGGGTVSQLPKTAELRGTRRDRGSNGRQFRQKEKTSGAIGNRFTHSQRSQHLFLLLFFQISTER